VAPIFGAAPLYIKKDKKWQMPLIMRPGLMSLSFYFGWVVELGFEGS